MLARLLRLFFWTFRVCVPATLALMLAMPVFLNPPAQASHVAKTEFPGARLLPISASSDQYTFLRLPDPTFVVVDLAPSTPVVTQSRTGMLLWAGVALLLAVLSLWLWRRKGAPPNNSFKPTPLRGAA